MVSTVPSALVVVLGVGAGLAVAVTSCVKHFGQAVWPRVSATDSEISEAFCMPSQSDLLW